MSWNCQSVNQLCERIRGVSYKKGDASNIPEKGYVPILRANNIGDDATLNYDGLVYVPADKVSAKQKLKVGDVVVAMSTGSSRVIGKTAQLNQEWQGAFGAFCGVLRPKNNVDARYFGHYFKTKEYRNGISGLAAGTNINNIKAEHFDEIEIPLPPLSEQRRIADKLDILLAKVNKCKSRLERIPEILKRFRQSVLADACSGKLTEDWREENGASAPIECRLGDALMDIRYGTAKKCEPNTSGVAVLRIPNVIHGEISHNDLKYTQLAAKEYSTLKLQAGDVLVIRSNGSISLVGAPALVTKAEAGFAFAGYLIRLRTDASKLVPAYLNYCLQSPQIRTQYGFTARSTSGVHNINGKEIASLSVNLPSLHEQKEIVRRINSLFEHARKLEERFEKGKTAFLRISESILSKAFRGELVGQDA